MNNMDTIVKDALSTADLKAGNGGYLNPEQSNRFIRGIIDQPTIIKTARSVIIEGETKKIEKLGFGARIMRPAEENVALLAADYAKPTFSKVDISTKEVIAEVRLSYDTLEANIEGANLKNTIISMIQERVALDLEELLLQGDLASADPYLAVLDGIIKKASSHVVDAANTEISLANWTNLIAAIPEKYLRDAIAYRIYTSRKIDLAWKNAIASRNTVAGDRFLLQNVNATALGFEIEPAAMMLNNSTYLGSDGVIGGTAGAADVPNLGKALMIHPKNIIVAFTRKVQMEQDKDISKRQHIIVVTMKVDVALEEADAVGKLINLKTTFTPA